MCKENDTTCRATRTERVVVANVQEKRQTMSLAIQIGESATRVVKALFTP